MRRVIAITAACSAALAVAAPGALAQGESDTPSPAQLAAQQCQAERAADRAAFRATYGHNATRNCIRAHRGESAGELRNAAQECRAEQDADPAGFATTYGTNKNGKNAFGKCVSSKVREETADDVDTFKNAAQDCRDERAADPAAFLETYGTNASQGKGARRNAFGKCVSTKVKEDPYAEE
jgi:hypothetical protein